MIPLNRLFTPTPQHNAGECMHPIVSSHDLHTAQTDIDADLVFQEMSHSHLTAAYSTPKAQHNQHVTTPNAPGASMAAPDYFLEDSATPSYFHEQDPGQASPPYFCDSPHDDESDYVLPPLAPDATVERSHIDRYDCATPRAYGYEDQGLLPLAAPAGDIEMSDTGRFGCETPRAYEEEYGDAQPIVAAMVEDLPAEDADQDISSTPTPEAPEVISNLQPIVLRTYQIKKKKTKYPDPEADITCTVEVITWSWFMNLPLELRNRIYGYYFFPEGKDWAPRPTFGLNNNWRMKPPALLQGDPYIRKEAISNYYRELKVSVASPEEDLVPWLKTLDPKARAALQDISIAYYDDDDSMKMSKGTKKSKCIDRCCRLLEREGVRIKRVAFSGVYMGGGKWL